MEATPKEENASSAKTFSTCPSTWTRTSASNSTAAEKVQPTLKTYLKIPTDACVVTGTLKGYDQLMNLVLDNVKEVTRGK